MGSFGEKLKREREMRAITLEEIAEATKIGTRSLRALEEEHFDQLPGGIFNKGFVRAYAKFLGIDEEQAVADYVAATNEVGTSTATQMQALAEEAERQRAAKEAAAANAGMGGMVAIIILIVVIGGIGFGAYKAYQYKKLQGAAVRASQSIPRAEVPPPVTMSQPLTTDSTATPATMDSSASTATPQNTPSNTVGANTAAANTAPGAATPTSTAAATSPAPSTTSKANPASTPTQPVKPASSSSTTSTTTPATTTAKTSSSSAEKSEKPAKQDYPIVVSIKAVKKSWIKVTADGKNVYQQEMDPSGDKKQITLHATDKMAVVIGNAAGIELTVNGKSAGSLGNEGQARTVNITPQGIQK